MSPQNQIVQEEITIKVSPQIAAAYRKATDEEKQQLEIKLAEIIQNQLTVIRRDSIIELKKTMDTMSQEAQDRGLTTEILDAILNDE
jgi:histidine ammonia-lyase